MSKYIIIILLVTSVLLGINIVILNIKNDRLAKENTRLSEMVALRDAAISEVDRNIASLQEQVLEAESICNERIKARNDVVNFLHINPPQCNWVGNSEAVPHPNRPLLLWNENPAHVGYFRDKEIITDEKSNIAIDSINRYWVQFTHTGDSEK